MAVDEVPATKTRTPSCSNSLLCQKDALDAVNEVCNLHLLTTEILRPFEWIPTARPFRHLSNEGAHACWCIVKRYSFLWIGVRASYRHHQASFQRRSIFFLLNSVPAGGAHSVPRPLPRSPRPSFRFNSLGKDTAIAETPKLLRRLEDPLPLMPRSPRPGPTNMMECDRSSGGRTVHFVF